MQNLKRVTLKPVRRRMESFELRVEEERRIHRGQSVPEVGKGAAVARRLVPGLTGKRRACERQKDPLRVRPRALQCQRESPRPKLIFLERGGGGLHFGIGCVQ
jgi:hypothetical protein